MDTRTWPSSRSRTTVTSRSRRRRSTSAKLVWTMPTVAVSRRTACRTCVGEASRSVSPRSVPASTRSAGRRSVPISIMPPSPSPTRPPWGQLAYYRFLAEQGEIRLIQSAAELDMHWRTWAEGAAGSESAPVGVIVMMEGADPIVAPAQVDEWFRKWPAECVSGAFRVESVRRRYRRDRRADAAGRRAPRGVRARRHGPRPLASLEEGYYEALDRFGGPVIASHNNCQALVPGDRQLSDDQIKRLIERGGVMGAVLDAWMLVPGWVHGESNRRRSA